MGRGNSRRGTGGGRGRSVGCSGGGRGSNIGRSCFVVGGRGVGACSEGDLGPTFSVCRQYRALRK